MSRSEELRRIFKDFDETKFTVVEPLIEEAVYLEEQMLSLKQYPFIKSREYKGEIQTKVTAAGKQYREYLQTYVNIIDKLCRKSLTCVCYGVIITEVFMHYAMIFVNCIFNIAAAHNIERRAKLTGCVDCTNRR